MCLDLFSYKLTNFLTLLLVSYQKKSILRNLLRIKIAMQMSIKNKLIFLTFLAICLRNLRQFTFKLFAVVTNQAFKIWVIFHC